MEYILCTKDYKHFELKSEADFVDPILFDDATLANGCFVGDRVLWDADSGCELVKRAEHPVLTGVLELNSKTKYGITSRGVNMYLFVPYRKDYPSLVVGCSEKDLTKNLLVLVRIDEAPPSGRQLPRGQLQDTLGQSGDPYVERLALLWAYTPYKMPSALMKMEAPEKKREILLRPTTPENTFHIDPAGCKDVDDVISIEEINGTVYIWITISDVAEYVQPGTDLDKWAAKFSATTYENGNASRPMLPPNFSENRCSLIPGNAGLGVSLVMEWNGSSLENLMFMKTSVRTKQTYNYEQADKLVDKQLRILKVITTHLTGNKEPDSHDIIEALMILYNREVASILRKHGVGILRKHDTSDITKWDKFIALAPEVAPLAYKAAEYCPADAQYVFHSGLNSDAYCTATSPIRRYADLVNQRILKAILAGQNPHQFDTNIEWLNKRQKEIKNHDRDLFFITNMFANENRIMDGIILDFTEKAEERQISFQVYFPAWKRIIRWTTGGVLENGKPTCFVNVHGAIKKTFIDELQKLRFQIYWNPQTRRWKDRLVLRLA